MRKEWEVWEQIILFSWELFCWILWYKETQGEVENSLGRFLNCAYTVVIENYLPRHLNCEAPSLHSATSWGWFFHGPGSRVSFHTNRANGNLQVRHWRRAYENISHMISVCSHVAEPPNLWKSKSHHCDRSSMPTASLVFSVHTPGFAQLAAWAHCQVHHREMSDGSGPSGATEKEVQHRKIMRMRCLASQTAQPRWKSDRQTEGHQFFSVPPTSWPHT